MSKTKILLVLAATGVLSCYGQELKEQDVPANVKDALAKTYPEAKNTEWENEDGNFEAEFKVNGKEQSVVYSPAGMLLETEVEIASSELPAGAAAYVSKNYKGSKIKEAAKITSADGMVTYEAEVNKKDLIFDSMGKFMRIEDEKDDDKDKD